MKEPAAGTPVMSLESTEQQSGNCYSTQTIATEEEVY